jgi:glyoxylase-like metal-dependent hydrolase (beta-lactamase superfamily II)
VADIDAVLITHHHPDHAGNAERLRSSGARVISHPADAPYLRGDADTVLPGHGEPWRHGVKSAVEIAQRM